MAQTGGPDVVVVKVREDFTHLELYIARLGSKPEYREFKSKELRELGNGMEAGGLMEAGGIAEAMRRFLMEMAQQGYSLTTTYTGGSQYSPATLIFTKKP